MRKHRSIVNNKFASPSYDNFRLFNSLFTNNFNRGIGNGP